MRVPLASALLLMVATSCTGVPIQLPGSGTGAPSGGTTTPGGSSVAADIVRFTNDARTRNGLPALRTNARLMEAARLHADQMAAYQRGEHTIPGARYPTMQSRLDAAGYAFMQAAENVAWNQQTAQQAVTTWMNSSGHRANILDAGLTEIGAAMARSSKGEPYWIQVFGRPR
jgi:uncharacterized protein YkwD